MGLIFKKSTAQPSFSVAAAITGTAEVGEQLTCTYTVLRARSQNVTVRWYSYFDNNGTDQVLLGTGTAYVLTGNEVGRYLRAIVTAINPAGTVLSTSDYTAAVTNTETPPDAPVITSAAAISGVVEVGATLTVSATFSGATSTAYQWYSYTSPGKSNPREMGTSNTQVIPAEDDGRYIGCVVTATNAAGPTVSEAAVVGPVVGVATAAPTIVSAAVVSLDTAAAGYNEGEYVICDAEFSGHTSTPAFAWYKCDAGRANPVLLDGDALAPIRPLPVSEPNRWRSALFLDQSLGLNAASKYIYCIASATNGEGTTPSESNAEGPIGAIQGTEITQAMVGDGPYYLTATSGTYYLSENISTKGTAFVVNRAGVKLNLNGKTVTFDNDTLKLANGGFESGATGWDFTNAPNASVYESPNFTADYNSRRLIDGTKSLLFNNTACAAASAQEYIKSATVTLEANNWYGFSCMAYASGTDRAVPFIRVRHVATDTVIANATITSSPTTTYKYGMAYIEQLLKAVHDPPEYAVEVGVTGTAGSTGVVYVDDVRLARSRAAGVACNPQSYRYSFSGNVFIPAIGTPVMDVTSYTSGGGGWVIKNGAIAQGQGGGQWATNVWFDFGVGAVARVTGSVAGPNSSAVRRVFSADVGAEIVDNTFSSTNVVCGQRENYWGSACLHFRGTFARNRFYGWTTTTITPSGSISAYGNEFYPKMRWTNGRVINCYAQTSSTPIATVHDNIIDASGEFYGTGIGIEKGFSGAIYNNIITCQTPALNQEYQGFSDFGIYPIQVENVSTGRTVEVYGNRTLGIAAGGTSDITRQYPLCCGFACTNMYAGFGTLAVYGNVFEAEASGFGRSSAINLNNIAGTLTISGNTLITNSGLLRTGNALGLTLSQLDVNISAASASKQHIFEIGYSATYPHFSTIFADTTYSPGSQAIVEAALPINYNNNTAGSLFAGASGGSISLAYTITFTGAAADTAIIVKDKDGNTVSSGTTNTFGEYAAFVPYQRVAGTTITNLNDHTVTVGAGPPVAFTSDATKIVSLA